MTATMLYDTEWQAEWCNGEAAWNMATLHAIGHPVPAADWHELEALFWKGYTPDEAAAAAALL